MDEFELIASRLRPLATGAEALGLADDTALLTPTPGQSLAITADMLHAGVHFFEDDPPALVAKKALRVNLSDLAAMGAEPLCYFLSLGLPEGIGEEWLAEFCAGLAVDQTHFGIRLAGGDTTRTLGPLALNVTALGQLPHGQALTRSGARPGDLLYVSGTVGDAALGLRRRFTSGENDPALRRYLLPEPRLGLGQALRGLASAAMDVSDGLVQDAGHIASASGVALRIEARRLPLSPTFREAIQTGEASWQMAATGGDDYELLFTLPPQHESVIETFQHTLPLTCIGTVTQGSGVQLIDPDGQPAVMTQGGYKHRF